MKKKTTRVLGVEKGGEEEDDDDGEVDVLLPQHVVKVLYYYYYILCSLGLLWAMLEPKLNCRHDS